MEFLLPFNASFFCLILFPDQTILMILSHFCETCTFLTSLWSKEKIKHEPRKLYPLAPSLFSDPFSIRDLSQYPDALSCKNARHSWKRQTQAFPLWLLPFSTEFFKSYQLVSIQYVSRCNQLLSTEKRLEEKQSVWSQTS